ncbi:GntR family transcriptional regulator [Micrococcus terreus]|jgi:DNA-binding GntR family transcriptional regulator|uniref:GntR family transcriptional regulator n=1 Tax=Micrococcus terreus TaxID=574650 RepID=UPI0021A3C328|nr:GntR family transcriptional regulator [Micrococcus terreus]MCT2087989.1 GntR family transcriptional regulator [Micrococcus terreus]
MTVRAESLTLTEYVRTALRADILSGQIGHGQPLRLEALMQRFDVSRSVVREVLIGLTEENLVVANPNKGFRVIDISSEGLTDLVTLRMVLEPEALARSIELGDAEWEAGIIAANHILDRVDDSASHIWGRSEKWVLAHMGFHEALCAACGNPRMISLMNALRKESAIYYQVRITAGHGEPEGIARDIRAEHRELMELAISRDAEGAIALLKEETWRTAEILRQSLDAGA